MKKCHLIEKAIKCEFSFPRGLQMGPRWSALRDALVDSTLSKMLNGLDQGCQTHHIMLPSHDVLQCFPFEEMG